MPLLEIDALTVTFRSGDADLHAVQGLSLSIAEGEVLAIVGETGCGKSVTSMSILRLLPEETTRFTGAIRFQGQNLLTASESEMRAIRGKKISMVFQEPMTSLNPVLTIGWQIVETLRRHESLSRAEAEAHALEMLKLVGIPDPESRLKEYPHQLSGGMRQRVMIAIALACNPKLLIADEPTTALDVTIQAQILDLMRDLNRRLGTAILFITHDLGVVAEIADRVTVMYAGRKVEEASVAKIFTEPRHPYTAGLLAAMPRLGVSLNERPCDRLTEIPGQVPSLREPLAGCPFHERCAQASEICRTRTPELRSVGEGHAVACHHEVSHARS
jgi:peptide/nickel transport system ATP-binding protein